MIAIFFRNRCNVYHAVAVGSLMMVPNHRVPTMRACTTDLGNMSSLMDQMIWLSYSRIVTVPPSAILPFDDAVGVQREESVYMPMCFLGLSGT
jgi:hypothetical protein